MNDHDLDELVIMDTDMSIAAFLSRVPAPGRHEPGDVDTICLPCRMYISVSDHEQLRRFVASSPILDMPEFLFDAYPGLQNVDLELGYFNLIARDLDDEDHPITLNGEPLPWQTRIRWGWINRIRRWLVSGRRFGKS